MNLLQVASDYYGVQAGNMGISQGGAMILMLAIGVLGWIVQARLQSVFAKYSKVPFPGMLTGAEVAAKMLRDNNVHNVRREILLSSH